MNIIQTAMYAANRIYDLGAESLETAKEVAKAMDEYNDDRRHQDRFERWIQHYEDSQKLTAYVGFRTAHHQYDAYIPNIQDTSDMSKIPDYTYVEGIRYAPFRGPIENYNSRRSLLKRRIEKHNADNDHYNAEHPHLHKNFKCENFGEGGENPAEQLTPEIPYLPDLEKALKEKIWDNYIRMHRQDPPTRAPSASIRQLDEMFSRGPVRWIWNAQQSQYELDFSH